MVLERLRTLFIRARQRARARRQKEEGVNDLNGLMVAVGGGDDSALAQVYERTRGIVLRAALRILRRHDQAEEVVQDVYTQAWRTAKRFDERRGSVETWLLTIARSRAIDRVRSRAARAEVHAPSRLEDEEAGSTRPSDDAVSDFDVRTCALSVLATLSPSDRRLLELAFYDGYSHSELAALLNVPLGTVKTRIRMSLLRMRRSLQAPPKPVARLCA
jgi:RNA polymerase sigma-70 factor (ECF subfamily)